MERFALSPSKPSAPAAIALRVLEAAQRSGASRAEVLCAAGFNPAAHPHDLGVIPLATLWRLWESALARLRDPGFPIAVAETYRPEIYGVISLMAITSAHLMEALEKMMRFYRLWTNSSCWRLEPERDLVHLVFVQPGERGLGQRCDQEFSLAEMVTAIRYVTGDASWAPLEARFAHVRPCPRMDRHEAHLHAELRFDTARDELLLRRSDLALPMVRADRMLAEFVEGHSHELLRRLGETPEDLLRIKSTILEIMRGRVPRLSEVAAALGIGARTLRRRLGDHGRTFTALIDETRSELARQYLEQSRYSIQQISHDLGFSEPSAFHRAFRRWTNQTPHEFRARARRMP